MARLRVLSSFSAKLRTGGYKGEPSGKIELTENHKTYNVADYAEAEANIPDPVLVEKSITENGTYSAEDDGADGYLEVNVNVPIPVPAFESKTATPQATQFDVEPSAGFDGLSKVTVNATPLETKTIVPTTTQQTVTPTSPNIGFSRVTVEGYVPPAEPEWKYVNFIDYDGTLLYSYTKAEVQALTEMPPLPVREGYTYTGWNWTLVGLKQAGRQIVGAVRMTTDTSTQFTFLFYDGDDLSIELKFQIKNGSVTIRWGDGTSDTFSNSSLTYQTVTANHTFSIYGKYIISMIMDGPNGLYNFGSSQSDFMFADNIAIRLIDVAIGAQVKSVGTFSNARILSGFSIPDSVTSFSPYPFQNTKLNAIVLPRVFKYGIQYDDNQYMTYACNVPIVSVAEEQTKIGIYMFASNEKLSIFNIANGITDIKNASFLNTKALQSIQIPSSVINIESRAFTNSAITKVDLSMYSDPNNIPSLETSNAFGSKVIFDVKNQTMLSAFEGATNWSTYAGQYQIGGEYAEVTT